MFQHHIQESHEVNFDNIKILNRASKDLKLRNKVMLYIRKLNLSFKKKSELITVRIRIIELEKRITTKIPQA